MEKIEYPIFIISKGRHELKKHTARFLLKEKIPIKIVIEPQEEREYSNRFGKDNIYILPFKNLGQGSIPARNWCWEKSIELGYPAHWIMDDNIDGFITWKNKKRVRCNSRDAFISAERFFNKYSNIAICGINYAMFGFSVKKLPPFYLNTRAYSCLLIKNNLSFRWRGRYNEDTDLCLQALTSGWCTININAYLINKAQTMTCKGGNMTELYKNRGRLYMARSLEYDWSHIKGLTKTIHRYGRPQHYVNWKIFNQRLIFKKIK